MKLLLTGITGQLGTAVAEIAPRRGIEIVPLVRRARPGQVPFERLFPSLAAARVGGDVREPLWGLTDAELDELAQDVDAVVNLAGDTNWAGSGRDLYAVNVLGALGGYEVARELQRRSGRRVVYGYASSIFVAGGTLGRIAETPLAPDRHRTAYEHSKWLAEQELTRRHGPGEPDVLISRVAALLGDSQTGATRKRNSLYLLAERWDELPGRVLPAMRGARVDVLPRDLAAGTLLDALAGLHRSGPRPEPVVTHLSAGERAPSIRGLLEVARAIAPLHFGKWLRLVPASAEQVLWLSANAERFLPLSQAWRNSLTGLRYIGLDRVMERGRLAGLVDGPLPEPSTELLARLLFDLPAPKRPLAPADSGLSRFLA
ncbi:SDR family oxidoreductase [Streptomyces botrytidirepellens]|uniref:NAD-dependent epimerase/dehydratase family protein n=1 Tax=Streptomyces botrytidirepellens TaxID=2486417 RepID=A0A3M8VL50_9ACTN|nr:SDR family oxidoreductase [Streptomyces botrytidirepellens]RNG18296.1 NAD-dependent epimerase/dehydratase family protein [Streptomyces botrytidirepellens]